jgi:hypothetical protein
MLLGAAMFACSRKNLPLWNSEKIAKMGFFVKNVFGTAFICCLKTQTLNM